MNWWASLGSNHDCEAKITKGESPVDVFVTGFERPLRCFLKKDLKHADIFEFSDLFLIRNSDFREDLIFNQMKNTKRCLGLVSQIL